MGEVRPMPSRGEVFTDIRGEDRTMRVSVHDDVGMVVVSLWAGRICRASFRLPLAEVGRLERLLAGLAPRQTGPATAGSATAGSAAAESATPEAATIEPTTTALTIAVPNPDVVNPDGTATDMTTGDVRSGEGDGPPRSQAC